MHPLARFAGLPPVGEAGISSPPSGEMSAKQTEGVHFSMGLSCISYFLFFVASMPRALIMPKKTSVLSMVP